MATLTSGVMVVDIRSSSLMQPGSEGLSQSSGAVESGDHTAVFVHHSRRACNERSRAHKKSKKKCEDLCGLDYEMYGVPSKDGGCDYICMCADDDMSSAVEIGV